LVLAFAYQRPALVAEVKYQMRTFPGYSFAIVVFPFHMSDIDWKSLLIGVVATLIGAFLLYLWAVSRGWFAANLSRWRHNLAVGKRFRNAGLSNFYASRADFARFRNAASLIDYLRTAKYSIAVAAYWMAQGNEAEGIASDIADLALRPYERTVTIAVIDPTGPCIPELSHYLDIPQDDLVRRIQSSLSNLHIAWTRLGPDERNRLTIKVYKTIPVASVIILDGNLPDGRIQVDIKPYRVARNNSFSFELTGPGHVLYDLCFKAWDGLIAEAEVLNPAVHLAGR